MAEGYHDWGAGEEVTAANLEDYTTLQSIMRFASSAARATALSGVLTEGLVSFLKDVNTIGIYSGSAWSSTGPVHGALTSWTPTVTQSGAVTVTNTKSIYTRTGRWIQFQTKLTVTGSGTSTSDIVISLPVTAATAGLVIGEGLVFDTSANAGGGGYWYGMATDISTTTMILLNTFAGGAIQSALGTSGFTAALASGDVIIIDGAYEAAADA